MSNPRRCPEWRRNLRAAPRTFVLERPVQLVDMVTGAPRESIPAGQLAIAWQTSSGGRDFWMTDYSVSHGVPSGIAQADLAVAVQPRPPRPFRRRRAQPDPPWPRPCAAPTSPACPPPAASLRSRSTVAPTTPAWPASWPPWRRPRRRHPSSSPGAGARPTRARPALSPAATRWAITLTAPLPPQPRRHAG